MTGEEQRMSDENQRTNPPMVPLPVGTVLVNGGRRCDMAIGACSCGAWHTEEENRPKHERWTPSAKANRCHACDRKGVETPEWPSLPMCPQCAKAWRMGYRCGANEEADLRMGQERPLTGEELAAKHGFKPHGRDPLTGAVQPPSDALTEQVNRSTRAHKAPADVEDEGQETDHSSEDEALARKYLSRFGSEGPHGWIDREWPALAALFAEVRRT